MKRFRGCCYYWEGHQNRIVAQRALTEDNPDCTTKLLICDNRRSYEEDEIYEINI